uniref:Dimer_Tnp_hAT domain-containing protein n=1 Tax=Strongyloides papillosus TaxID=174720 RepID=A0A0N5BBT6_STREA
SDILNVDVNDINILELEAYIAKLLKVNLCIYDNGYLYSLLNCISNDYSRNCPYSMLILQKSNNYFQIVSKVFPSSSTNSLNFPRLNSIEEELFFSFILKASQYNVQVNVSELEIELDKINCKKGYKAKKNNLQKIMVLIEEDEDTSTRYEEYKNKISVTTVDVNSKNISTENMLDGSSSDENNNGYSNNYKSKKILFDVLDFNYIVDEASFFSNLIFFRNSRNKIFIQCNPEADILELEGYAYTCHGTNESKNGTFFYYRCSGCTVVEDSTNINQKGQTYTIFQEYGSSEKVLKPGRNKFHCSNCFPIKFVKLMSKKIEELIKHLVENLIPDFQLNYTRIKFSTKQLYENWRIYLHDIFKHVTDSSNMNRNDFYGYIRYTINSSSTVKFSLLRFPGDTSNGLGPIIENVILSKNFIMFSSSTMLQKLKECKILLSDVCYSLVNKSYYAQLYTIHGKLEKECSKGEKRDIWLPLAMLFLKSCSEAVYTEAFSYLKRILYIEHKAILSPDEWIVDLEYAAINSIKNTYEIPQEKISLCFFHYSNALFREINSLGLTKDYLSWKNPKKKNEKILSAYIRRVFSLVFLPEKEIIEVYKKIKLDLDDICNSRDLEDVVVEKVKKFFDYFQKQWIYSNILLSSLCKYRKSCRSTNVAESFHSTVKRFGVSNTVTIEKATSRLREYLDEVELKIVRLQLNSSRYFPSLKRRTYRNLIFDDKFLFKTLTYDSKEITTENYLDALSRLVLREEIMANPDGTLSLYNGNLEDNICEVFDPSTQQHSLENEQTPIVYSLRKIPQSLKHTKINDIINSGSNYFANSSIQVIIKKMK